MTTPRRRIAVVLGGRSSEHEISLASAESVIDALAESHDVVTVEIGRDGAWALGEGQTLDTSRRAIDEGQTLDTSRRATRDRLAGRAAAQSLPVS